VIRILRCIVFVFIFHAAIPAIVHAQTATIIPANEAAAHIGEYAAVQGVVAKVFTSNSGKLELLRILEPKNMKSPSTFKSCFLFCTAKNQREELTYERRK
jgi:hypothetical protein